MNERMEWLMTAVKGNQEAAEFLHGLIGVLHVWDDLIDKDTALADAEINQAFWFVLVGLPRNTFYRQHFDLLNPLLMVAIQNWYAANKMERNGDAADRRIAFVLRSSYVDLVTQSALIAGGLEWAEKVTPDIRRFAHSEGYAQYLINLKQEIEKRGSP